MEERDLEEKNEEDEELVEMDEVDLLKQFRKFCRLKKKKMEREKRESYENGKKLFKVYYNIKQVSEKLIDLTNLQGTLELMSCFGFPKNTVTVLESLTIENVNRRRMERNIRPAMFHLDKNAVFDITLEEIEEELRHHVSVHDENDAIHLREVGILLFADLLFENLEEKYLLLPSLEVECLDEQETTDLRLRNHDEDFTKEELEKSLKCLNHKLKQEKMKWKEFEMEAKFVRKQRETVIKSIIVLRRFESLKVYKVKYPSLQIDLRRRKFTTGLTIKRRLCTDAMEFMDDVIDEFYQILIKLRRKKGKTPLTLHEPKGIFDVTLEEVENGLEYFNKCQIKKGFGSEPMKKHALLFHHQLHCRHVSIALPPETQGPQ